jgi:hypothetical protein
MGWQARRIDLRPRLGDPGRKQIAWGNRVAAAGLDPDAQRLAPEIIGVAGAAAGVESGLRLGRLSSGA